MGVTSHPLHRFQSLSTKPYLLLPHHRKKKKKNQNLSSPKRNSQGLPFTCCGVGGIWSGLLPEATWALASGPGSNSSCCQNGPLPWPGPEGTSADLWLSWNRPWESPRAATAVDKHPRIPLECSTRIHWALRSWVLCYFFLIFGWSLSWEFITLKLPQNTSSKHVTSTPTALQPPRQPKLPGIWYHSSTRPESQTPRTERPLFREVRTEI